MSVKDTIAQKLATIAANSPRVYAAGKAEGVEEGKKTEYDAFWDAFQDNGAKTRYNNAFSGDGWNSVTLRPKYMVAPESGQYGCARIFYFCNIFGETPIDFREIEDKFDFSKTDILTDGFQDALIDHITIDLSNIPSLSNTFASPFRGLGPNYLHLTVSENNTFTSTFAYNSRLTDIVIDGVIAKGGFNTQWARNMTKASLVSIVNALSTSTTGLTVTLSLVAVKKAFETYAGANDGNTSAEWTALVATKTNWTISLV